MSRSYKKFPCVKDSNSWAKKQANKKVRKHEGGIQDGKFYRKFYNPWDISDWAFHKTWRDYWDEQLKKWEQRFDTYAWSDKPRGYCAHYRYRKCADTHWSKQDPRLHKKKHYGLWKKEYKGK